MEFRTAGVIGAGAWGTALAQVAAYGDRPVRIWARDPAVAEAINTTHANPLYLPNIALSPSIEAVSDPAAMAELEMRLLHNREVVERRLFDISTLDAIEGDTSVNKERVPQIAKRAAKAMAELADVDPRFAIMAEYRDAAPARPTVH